MAGPQAATMPDVSVPVRRRRPVTAGVVLAALFSLALFTEGQAQQYQPGTPFTWLFDTGTTARDRVPARQLADKTRWKVVPEGNLTHRFTGDPVIANDKLTVLLRTHGPGAEVYAETASGLKARALLMASGESGGDVRELASLRIVENTPARVELEASYETSGSTGPSTVRYGLTTGQSLVEMTPGEHADRLLVWCRTSHLVVPDFLADDMVFGPQQVATPRMALPTENFLLHLIRGGDAMVMCAWRTAGRDCRAIAAGSGSERTIHGSRIAGTQDERVWVAFLEDQSVWHEQDVPTRPGAEEVFSDWKPPFDARWRIDSLRPDGFAQSHSFDGVTPPAVEVPGPLLVYALDRTRATPLVTFCPTDVLRNTLGVGPCQYVLAAEGLGADTSPTPDQAMDWIERQFQRGKNQETREEIRDHLDHMIQHVRGAGARIDRYGDFAGRARALLEEGTDEPSGRHAELLEVIRRLEKVIDDGRRGPPPIERISELTESVLQLVGQSDAAAKCKPLGEEIRAIGSEQDRTLSRCRMTLRWLRQLARSDAAGPQSFRLADEIRKQSEEILQFESKR